jgi:hypothetical protein
MLRKKGWRGRDAKVLAHGAIGALMGDGTRTAREADADASRQPSFDELADPTAQARVEEVELFDAMEDDSHPLGAVVTRAMSIALEEFGEAGFYWVLSHLVIERSETEALRAFSDDLKSDEFERVRRDMQRKFPQIGATILARLADDPEVRRLAELLHVPATPRREPAAPIASARYRSERERFLARRRDRMEAVLRAHATLAEHATRILAEDLQARRDDGSSPLLDQFVATENNPTERDAVLKELHTTYVAPKAKPRRVA